MKNRLFLLISLILFFFAGFAASGCGLGGGSGDEGAIDFQRIIATAKEKVYPALVFVKPIKETFSGGERRRVEVLGSGVIISADGYVVTNNHVAEDAIEVNCVLGDKEQIPATVVGVDPETDLALLKLQIPEGHAPLTVAEFADSNKVQAGQFVMALGSPFGFSRSISLGIVSNTTRYLGFGTQHIYNLWFQTDATINPGNSGGPLVNTNGKIIGINTLGMRSGGIGFAVPSNVVKDIISRLTEASADIDKDKWPVKVQRSYLGLQLQAINDFQTNTFTDCKVGALIRSVDSGSPADLAGIKNGDILLSVSCGKGKYHEEINGLYVEELPAIRVNLADLPPEKTANFVIARAGEKVAKKSAATMPASKPSKNTNTKTPVDPTSKYIGKIGQREIITIPVTPVTRGKFEGEDFDCKKWNMTVKEITKFSNPALHFLKPEGGVFIQGVRYPGNAEDAGLGMNDILLKIGKTNIKTIDDVKKVYEKLINDKKLDEKKVLVTIKRGGFTEWKMLNWQKDYLRED